MLINIGPNSRVRSLISPTERQTDHHCLDEISSVTELRHLRHRWLPVRPSTTRNPSEWSGCVVLVEPPLAMATAPCRTRGRAAGYLGCPCPAYRPGTPAASPGQRRRRWTWEHSHLPGQDQPLNNAHIIQKVKLTIFNPVRNNIHFSRNGNYILSVFHRQIAV